MRTLTDIYNEWGQYLETTDGTEPFAEVCHKLKVHPVDLNELIFEETGMSGPEVLNLYLDNAPKNN